MKKFFQEFKKFINRGNVMDLAVGVIVGAAFTAIVTALTNNIIRPIINWIIALIGGKDGLSAVYTFLSKTYAADGTVDLANSIYIDWGKFITAILDFFIIAFTVFLIVKAFNASREKLREFGELIEKESKKERIAERKAMKLKAKEEKRSFKVVWAEYLADKKAIADEKAKLEADEKARKEAEDKLNNPTEQQLLKEIRDLLKENQELKKNSK